MFEYLAFGFIELNQLLLPQADAADKTPVTIKLNEIKARFMWLDSVLVYFLLLLVLRLLYGVF